MRWILYVAELVFGVVVGGVVGSWIGARFAAWYCGRLATIRKWDREIYTEWLDSPYADKREYARQQLERLDKP